MLHIYIILTDFEETLSITILFKSLQMNKIIDRPKNSTILIKVGNSSQSIKALEKSIRNI